MTATMFSPADALVRPSRPSALKLLYEVDRKWDRLEVEPPLHPPLDWFTDEAADEAPPRVKVFPDGRFAGVVAPAGRCLLDGSGECWVVPRPADGRGSVLGLRGEPGNEHDYDLAHVGDTLTAEGIEIPTAVLPGPGGHANPWGSVRLTRAHYDDTDYQLGRMRYVWSDQAGGLVVLGALWPDLTPRQVESARASAASVDYRWIEDEAQYRLVASCLVNVGGLPSRVAAALDHGDAFMLDAWALRMLASDESIPEQERWQLARTAGTVLWPERWPWAEGVQASIDEEDIERDEGGRFAPKGGGSDSGALTPDGLTEGKDSNEPPDPAADPMRDQLAAGMLPDGVTSDGEPIRFYEVGGAVRDELVGIDSKDVDYTVEASSYEAMREYVTGTLGMRIAQEKPEFATIKALAGDHPLAERTQTVDFVMARVDGPSSDGRHPDWTRPGTLAEDLDRRDFTMNAVAKDNDGNVIDPHGGRADLASGTLRFVGDPAQRLEEDGIRAIRGLRFMATKGMTADGETDAALRSDVAVRALMAESVSPERLQQETSKMFNGPGGTAAALDVLGRYPELHGAIFRDGVRLDVTRKAPKSGSVEEGVVQDDGWMGGVRAAIDPDDIERDEGGRFAPKGGGGVGDEGPSGNPQAPEPQFDNPKAPSPEGPVPGSTPQAENAMEELLEIADYRVDREDGGGSSFEFERDRRDDFVAAWNGEPERLDPWIQDAVITVVEMAETGQTGSSYDEAKHELALLETARAGLAARSVTAGAGSGRLSGDAAHLAAPEDAMTTTATITTVDPEGESVTQECSCQTAAAEAEVPTEEAVTAAYVVSDIPAGDSLLGAKASDALIYGDEVTWSGGIGMFSDAMDVIDGSVVLAVIPQIGGALDFENTVLVPSASATATGRMFEWVDPVDLPLDSMVIQDGSAVAAETPAIVEAPPVEVVEDEGEFPAGLVASVGLRLAAGRIPASGRAVTRTESRLAAVEAQTQRAVASVEAKADSRLAAVEGTMATVATAMSGLTDVIGVLNQRLLASEIKSV